MSGKLKLKPGAPGRDEPGTDAYDDAVAQSMRPKEILRRATV